MLLFHKIIYRRFISMSTTPLEKAVDDFVQGLSLQRLREYAFNHIIDEYRYNTISDDKLLNDFIKD
tara:strand:+ start:596 stop:793 length:198 start_codon:yes stop_codon:yes gene_type:complete